MKKCICILLACILLALPVSAHSGRTDSAGGHRDNKNVSGLGSYHYHHGYGPHLHPNGVCPYAATTASPAPAAPAKSTPAAPAARITSAVGAQQKADFLDEHIALIPSEGSSLYHKLGCADFDETDGFIAYNIAAAQAKGYTACPKCHS